MKSAGDRTLTFFPKVLWPLYFLALDLKGSSSAAAEALWSQVAPQLWASTRNPWLIVHVLPEKRIEELAHNTSFCHFLHDYVAQKKQALVEKRWFETHYGPKKDHHIAYFSLEFGLSEALPIYSGGLGLLAGDHLKASCDLGIPLTGIGLLYQRGYFRQTLDLSGKQVEFFPCNHPAQLPITRTVDAANRPLFLQLALPGRSLFLRVWHVRVGTITLYLLDSNDLRNTPADRGITDELYGGGREQRLQQEIVLAQGGSALLRALALTPTFYHLNEGHAALVVVERCLATLSSMQTPSFSHALAAVKKRHLFTTHTPVAAGFDRFDPDLMAHYFRATFPKLGLSQEDFLALGRADARATHEPFNMAFLAARGSAYINGVSRVHAQVSQELFAPLFPHLPLHKVPVGFVTNGVHVPSWESPEADRLWEKACGPKRWLGDVRSIEDKILALDPVDLWALRRSNKQRLIEYVDAQLNKDSTRFCHTHLSPDVLTLGFSRRFATYKRVDLLLRDERRLEKILTQTDVPVQLILAGKAHPKDEAGKKLIERWLFFLRQPTICPHAIFLADYDILLAERLVQGVDVWINTPRFPWEASGTSGMKVLANGGLNCSELDGWWAEAYFDKAGWALGDQQRHANEAAWDETEADALYTLLEREIIPLYYHRDSAGIPIQWLEKVKQSMATLTPRFSANRMVREYVETYYLAGGSP